MHRKWIWLALFESTKLHLLSQVFRSSEFFFGVEKNECTQFPLDKKQIIRQNIHLKITWRADFRYTMQYK